MWNHACSGFRYETRPLYVCLRESPLQVLLLASYCRIVAFPFVLNQRQNRFEQVTH